jgi:hypothetical protein
MRFVAFRSEGQEGLAVANSEGAFKFGPYFITADEIPPGGKGLCIQTRLDGTTVQDASTDEMVFSVTANFDLERGDYTLARRHHRERHASRRWHGAETAFVHEAW